MAYSPLIETLADLVRINSVNPAYEGGRPEAQIQAYVAEFLRAHGIDVRVQEVLPERANVIGMLPGRNARKRIVFEAHTDTAGVDGMTIDPFSPKMCNGRMYGRGTCDTKAGLAAMLHAIADLKRSGTIPESEVWVAATVDEEFAYRGVLRLCENLRADAAVVAEPTETRLVTASKGCVRWRIAVKGRAAHSSKPHLGVNAIYGMCRIIAALERTSAQLRVLSHALVGSPTVNVGVIRGGTQVNIVPEFCAIEIDRRLIPGESPDAVFEHYKELIQDLSLNDSGMEVEVEAPVLKDWPLETSPDAAVVKMSAMLLDERGLNGQPAGVDFGSDASKLARAKIPSIIFGPGSIDHAHTADEFVELEQMELAFDLYRDLMMRFQ
jgi:acetylornithine deacetylase/succinyl-diaminopimelate desuccinylase family protein